MWGRCVKCGDVKIENKCKPRKASISDWDVKTEKNINSSDYAKNLLLNLLMKLRNTCNLSFYKISKILKISQYNIKSRIYRK